MRRCPDCRQPYARLMPKVWREVMTETTQIWRCPSHRARVREAPENQKRRLVPFAAPQPQTIRLRMVDTGTAAAPLPW